MAKALNSHISSPVCLFLSVFLPESTSLHVSGWLVMPLYGQDQASLGVKSALLAYFYWALVRSKDVPGSSGKLSRFYHPQTYLSVSATLEF